MAIEPMTIALHEAMSTDLHPVISNVSIQPLINTLGTVALVLVAVICFGAVRWKQSNGKVFKIGYGFLLLFLAGVLAFVLYADHKARTGSPR